jgi:hypothetical protein
MKRSFNADGTQFGPMKQNQRAAANRQKPNQKRTCCSFSGLRTM